MKAYGHPIAGGHSPDATPLAWTFIHAFFHAFFHPEYNIDATNNRSNEPRDRHISIVMSGRPKYAMMDKERLDAGKLHASKSPL
jgi:hypothetical protein